MHNYLKYFSKNGIFSRYNMAGIKYIKLKVFLKTGRVKMNFYFQKLFKNTSSLSSWVKKISENSSLVTLSDGISIFDQRALG